MNFDPFDLGFLVLLLSFTLLSYLRGALKEFLGLLGLVCGYFAANWYTPGLADILRPLLPDEHGAELLSFILIMMAGYFIGIFLSGFSDIFRQSPESALSRLIAGVIGFGKGLVIALAIYGVIQAYIPTIHEKMDGSWIAGRLARILTYIQGLDLI